MGAANGCIAGQPCSYTLSIWGQNFCQFVKIGISVLSADIRLSSRSGTEPDRMSSRSNIQSWVECMGALTLSHSVLLSSEYFSECGTLNSAELNICCNIHSVQLSRGEGLYSAPLSISNLPLERFGDVYFEKNVDRCWKFAQCGKIFCTVWQFLAFSHLNMIIRVSGLIH